jgi:hypothetical protein
MHWRGRSAKLPRRVCTEIAPGDADRAHVSDAVSDVTARSAATEDAADCVGEFWFPWDTAGLIEASEVPSACADDNSITNRCFAHEDRRRGLQPASAHTSATMWGWDTMAPRRVGIIPGGIPASSARLPAEDAAEAVARIEAVAIDGRVNVGRPAHASGETAWDLLPCRGLPHASTGCFFHAVQRSATQRDSHPSHPLCRLQRSGDSEQTIRRDLRHRIAAPAPKQLASRTHRPPSVDRISAPGPTSIRCIATRQSADSEDRRQILVPAVSSRPPLRYGGRKMKRRSETCLLFHSVRR